MEIIFQQGKVPVLQNKVYPDYKSAIEAPFGSLKIQTDSLSKLSSNVEFDSDLMIYDQDYDNSVPSKIFMDYYDEIADYLNNKYDLSKGKIIDIGCGKGTFIKKMAERFSEFKYLGIDPSYEGEKSYLNGKVEFIDEYFAENHLNGIDSISLIICRHTMEHIPSPSEFLKNMFQIIETKMKSRNYDSPIPVFIEVPDLKWILQNNAFWDFCYEHVNYFTKESLYNCIELAGAFVTNIQNSFGEQYQWAECNINAKNNINIFEKQNIIDNSVLTNNFEMSIQNVIKKVTSLNLKENIVIWGMATKGVLYTLHLMNNNISVSKCIDININKQGKYVPITGYKIEPPLSLKATKGSNAIICMNPNYVKEIFTTCKNLAIEFTLYDAELNEIILV